MSAPLQRSLQKYAFGQVLSIILASTGLINGWLFEIKNLNIPAVQAALTYSLILVGSLLYLWMIKPQKTGTVALLRKHKGILLGSVLFDVAANWLVVKAFSELKMAEVMVFSGLSTPAAILLACMWTRPRPKYTRMQGTGVLIAMTAIAFYFYISQSDHTSMTNSVTGIMCAICSAVAYAASNNFQERVAQAMQPVEFLLGLGLIGSLISWIIVLGSYGEVTMLVDKLNDYSVLILISLYAMVLSSFYLLIPVYMSRHSAVSFNFSLLTANFLGIIGSWWLLEASYSSWLYVSVVFINLGLLLYYAGEESCFESKIKEDSERKDCVI